MLKSIFDKITQEKFTYLFIDCTSYSDLKYRFKYNIFDKYIRVYIMNQDHFSTMYLISPSQKIQLEKSQNKFQEKSIDEEKGTLKFSLENSSGICDDGLNVRIKPISQRKNLNSTLSSQNNSSGSNQGGYFSENHPDDPITPPMQEKMNDENGYTFPGEIINNPPDPLPISQNEKNDSGYIYSAK